MTLGIHGDIIHHAQYKIRLKIKQQSPDKTKDSNKDISHMSDDTCFSSMHTYYFKVHTLSHD